jgi:FKBP-type peptidyl-prolyl cis-trans isomerase (trigger factor)
VIYTAEGDRGSSSGKRDFSREIDLNDATVAFCGIKSTRQELEERMDELARKYVETDEKEIVEELYRLARELEKMEKKSLD